MKLAKRTENIKEYYFSSKLAEVRALDSADKHIINLGIGNPNLPPSKQVIEQLVNHARKPESHGYQSYRGIPELRQAIRTFYGQTYDVHPNPNTEILPLIGSKEGIMHICMALINPDDEVLVPNPGYPTYRSAAQMMGALCTPYPLREENQWAIDMDALRQHNFDQTKIMFVNSPHMPTGSVISEPEWNELIDLAHAHNFILVHDNPYSLILNSQPQSIFSFPKVKKVGLELNTLSKSHNMAGWRVGWVIGNETHINALLQVKSNMDSGMFLGIQQAAVEALKLGSDWFEQQNRVYHARRQLGLHLLDELGCRYKAQQPGLFIWAKVPDAVIHTEKWVDEILYATHIFIAPGFIFGTQGNRYIRMSLCAQEDEYIEAIKRIQVWKSQTK